MSNDKHIELTASEIGTLWTQYQSKTLAVCILKHSINNTDDHDIKLLMEDTLSIMNTQVSKVSEIFGKEDYPIPQGLTKEDVNMDAPRLFSDKLYLLYLLSASYLSLNMYAMSLAMAERGDIIDYFSESLTITIKEHKRIKELAEDKGIHIHAPHIPVPEKIDFVKKQSFLTGWFGNRRPLNSIEISNLVVNAQQNALGQALITGFGQVAESKDVRRFFERGRDISGKHLEIFQSLLREDYLSEASTSLVSEVTDSKEAPFSDKLMMNLIDSLIAASIGQYGVSMAKSPRHDLGVHYARLSAEAANYSNDGANMMIDQGWMEQPPMAANRKNLAK
ncbi:DUF3231 family protein [Oceanobacillus bengalensis]|uniref:DUF3231 family protein n=1 Tax=Oceanobacillus bengalensis TaxID=1435466 RepID=A0A494YUG7_9BACI|nr:DUF3231 family protein [Oceanobacillus bengalensis]RKQ13794.1 DUF3231 family protein [Oceanobacillus bengalensis]